MGGKVAYVLVQRGPSGEDRSRETRVGDEGVGEEEGGDRQGVRTRTGGRGGRSLGSVAVPVGRSIDRSVRIPLWPASRQDACLSQSSNRIFGGAS